MRNQHGIERIEAESGEIRWYSPYFSMLSEVQFMQFHMRVSTTVMQLLYGFFVCNMRIQPASSFMALVSDINEFENVPSGFNGPPLTRSIGFISVRIQIYHTVYGILMKLACILAPELIKQPKAKKVALGPGVGVYAPP
jgi:hypothetical protein